MTTPALRLDHISKTYPQGTSALKSVTLEVPAGEFFALLGVNGAGKSTLINIISSLLPATSGNVHIFGVDLAQDPAGAKSMLGVVPQEFNFMQFERVIDILTVQAGYFGIPKAHALPRALMLLKRLGLHDKRFDKARALSGGMKRRLMIARALIHKPRLLILDEPTAGVDVELRHSMWEFIQEINQEEDTSIILTTHYLEEAEQLCQKVAILNQGVIAINTQMKDLLNSLDTQTFVVDVATAPMLDNALQNAGFFGIDDKTLGLTVKEHTPLNDALTCLLSKRVAVQGVRPKTGRLEELFLQIIDKKHQPK